MSCYGAPASFLSFTANQNVANFPNAETWSTYSSFLAKYINFLLPNIIELKEQFDFLLLRDLEYKRDWEEIRWTKIKWDPKHDAKRSSSVLKHVNALIYLLPCHGPWHRYQDSPCGFRWPLKTTCDIHHHPVVPFPICCHAVVLFTSSRQMVIIMNAFIANVIRPNVTSIGDETDTRGGYTVPIKEAEKWGSLVWVRKLL